MRRGDEDGIHTTGADEVFAAGELSRLWEARELFRYLAADSRHFATRDSAGDNLFCVSRAHGADTDDSETNGCAHAGLIPHPSGAANCKLLDPAHRAATFAP
jgi:hypothetical protein